MLAQLREQGFSQLQKLGKALMLPVAVLPAAGLLLGIGAAHFDWFPLAISQVMEQAGGAIFGNLPLIFAVGVALGYTENDGVAGLAAVVGFAVLIATMGVVAKTIGVETTSIMGVPSLDTGVFGGIVIGMIAGVLFNRYYRIELPTYLGFLREKDLFPLSPPLPLFSWQCFLPLSGRLLDRLSKQLLTLPPKKVRHSLFLSTDSWNAP